MLGIRFMNAIDHMGYHPSQTNDQWYYWIHGKKERKGVLYSEKTGWYIPNTQTLSPGWWEIFEVISTSLKKSQFRST